MSVQSELGGVALITGAASGIGKETAFTFAEAGVQALCFADVSGEGAEKAAQESKTFATHPYYSAIATKIDVQDADAVQRMVERVVSEFGRIDYVINSAGISGSSSAPIQHLKIDDFDRLLSTNLRGTMLCVRAVSKQMALQEPRQYSPQGRHASASRSLGRGVIINLGSIASLRAAPGMTGYVASKHAVVGLTKVAALELMPLGIRVNAVCPSWTETPMVQQAIEQKPALNKIIQRSPGGRSAFPEEVAGAILFLCQPSATYINGSNLVIDGGQTNT